MKNFMQLPIATRLMILGAIGLAARVAVSVFFGDNNRIYYESMTIANNILQGHGYSFDEWGRTALQPTSFLPPLSIYWCLFWMWLFPGNYLPMYLAQAVVQISGIVPAYLTGKKMFSETVGWWFAVIFTVYPEFMYMHSRPATEFLYVTLALWTIYFYAELRVTDLHSKKAIQWSIWIGFIGATAVLVKEGAGILIAAMLFSLIWGCKEKWLLIKRVYVPMALVAAIIMSPWVIRNYVVHSELVLVRTGYGVTAWIANHHGATGTDKTADGSYVLAKMDTTYANWMNRSLPADEQDRDRFYKKEVIRFIQDYPGEYLSLTAKRLLYYVWFDPTHPIARSIVYRAGYILLLLLALPGFVIARRKRKLDRLILIAISGYLVLYVPVLVLPRYRIIPVTFLLLLAAVTVDYLLERWKARTVLKSA
jgi:hypothetical protein